ncbi:MAG: rhomboid family intramembrane serine protease [Flavobacteriaceae bacterium]|tara:strand:+ start:176 stop:919 length:744 start_codon:yes stop_codon:yes gene_type:complete
MGRISDTVKHLIIINVIFFLATQIYGDVMYQLFSLWFPENENFSLWQIISHMFMHGGFMHIFFNMYALWAFGSPLENSWGKKKFLFFYISAGLGATLIHTSVNYLYLNQGISALESSGIDKNVIMELLTQGKYNPVWYEFASKTTIDNMISSFSTPAVGASGAIYGVLVAFGIAFPNSELFLMFVPVPIKAKYFIPALIGLDLFSGVTGYSLFGAGIAHFAHVGGALFGFIMAWYWKKKQTNNQRWN